MNDKHWNSYPSADIANVIQAFLPNRRPSGKSRYPRVSGWDDIPRIKMPNDSIRRLSVSIDSQIARISAARKTNQYKSASRQGCRAAAANSISQRHLHFFSFDTIIIVPPALRIALLEHRLAAAHMADHRQLAEMMEVILAPYRGPTGRRSFAIPQPSPFGWAKGCRPFGPESAVYFSFHVHFFAATLERRSVALRPKRSGRYISSTLAAGAVTLPAARTRAR